MKRLDLVQLTIIIVGLISAFFCLKLIPAFLFYLFTWFADGLSGSYILEEFIGTILSLTCYLLFSLYSIKHSKQLAEWISNKASLHGAINLALTKSALLYALFIGLGLYGVIEKLPPFLIDAYHYIRGGNESSLLNEMAYQRTRIDVKEDLIMEFISLGLFFILLVYARTFADFFAARINNTEPEDEINPVTE